MMGLDGGRVNIAACSLGGARACLEAATAHLKQRPQFGRPLADIQAMQFRVDDMATDLHAARLLVWRAAPALHTHPPHKTQPSPPATPLAHHPRSTVHNDENG